MSQTLNQIAHTLVDSQKKVQLIYAFNGTGKTRLSQEFIELIYQKEAESRVENRLKVLYYNSFTEDLFYWNNTIEDFKLKIQPNTFIDWIIRDRGQDKNITTHFQRYTDDKLTPFFIEHKKVVNDGKKKRN